MNTSHPARLAEAPAVLRGIADDIEPRHALSAGILRLIADDLGGDAVTVGPAPDHFIAADTDRGDEARVPVWVFESGVQLDGAESVSAWVEGVAADGDLTSGEAVDAVERDARRLLAAVAWHRRVAAGAAPEPPDRRPRAEHPCPDCGGEVLRIEHAMDPATYRCRDQFDCAWSSDDPPADPDQPEAPPRLSWSAEKDDHAWVVLGRDNDAPADESVCVSLRVVEAVDPDSGEDVSELLAHAVRELLAVDWRGRVAAVLTRCSEIEAAPAERPLTATLIPIAEVRALLGGGA